MSRTFTVSKVEPATQRLDAIDREQALPSLVHGRVEQMWTSNARLVLCDNTHPLVQMAHNAFYEHRPIALSPDAIWFCLAQGFAHHVNRNVERLRKRFVSHEGKVELVITRPDFMLGQFNPWPEAFSAFSAQLALHLGKLRDLVVADFSTTGLVERAASEVVLMDAFQGYFDYGMRFGCGIPAITLLGTAADWRSVRLRAAMFGEIDPDLEPWTRALLPVLDRIVQTAEGHDDAAFWQSFFHYRSSSMGSELTGWIHVLFPYLDGGGAAVRERNETNEEAKARFEEELRKARERMKTEPNRPRVRERPSREDLARHAAQAPVLALNPHLGEWEREYQVATLSRRSVLSLRGPRIGDIPSGLASARVTLTDMRTEEKHRMRFVAGMFGVIEDVDGALAPEFGWAVVHEPQPDGSPQ